MTSSWRNDHPRIVDAVLIALLLCAAAGQATLNSSLPDTVGHLGWRSALPLAVLAGVALLWRRGHPRAVVAVTALCVAAEGGLGYLVSPVNLAPVMVALYELAVRRPGRTTRLHYAAATAAIVVAALLGNRYGNPWPLAVLNPTLFLLLPVALGETARLRHAFLAEEARHRVAEERVRIARDLHDVVAHHLALANAQAGTAAYLARSHPDQVRKILADLTTTTSSALRELKATVGVLRHDSPLEPAPGLGQLPALTAAFGSAGLAVDVTVDGTERPLTPNVDLTAFRILQEALTNVTRHASTNTAHVRLTYGEDRLTMTVTNAAATRPANPGFGIVDMRERASAAGGHLHAGPHPDGGFLVTTQLPILARP
ncbi:sensor histidine kinase [Actinophytocola oryzae]|uniref:histidine kinase n=1 Tax=Actinophytocola oryzae TaxID=502181 RepID=A0A4R7W4B4_9PSEU|nr:sensor histidine kinase [Actinophytocola oryzae]TDV57414.1 histidine kinase [Actinophytocola oryzae]